MRELDSRQYACLIAGLLHNKQAGDIEILNISNISVIADYFVICSANSGTHARTLSGYIRENLKNNNDRLPQKEEADLKNRWYLLDYGDIIVHIMHHEERTYYAIEKFWSHACRISRQEWQKEIENMEVKY